MMEKGKGKGKGKRRSDTRRKILDAGMELMKKEGFESLTVRKICQHAGASIGSFYHFFNSVDELFAEFQMHVDAADADGLKDKGLLEYIVALYGQHIDNCCKMGVEFTSNYYNPRNKAFNIHTRRPGTYPASLYGPCLAEAQHSGDVNTKLPAYAIVEDLRAIVVGNVFIWCSSDGIWDVRSNTERMLRTYLQTIFTEQYFRRFPDSKLD